ncbi:MAG: hypothetical protein J7647_32155 [Cyanobacteria bacterium SBLK]|nr:hypothetical protein [Cyanobacteria bacterium SBLK]
MNETKVTECNFQNIQVRVDLFWLNHPDINHFSVELIGVANEKLCGIAFPCYSKKNAMELLRILRPFSWGKTIVTSQITETKERYVILQNEKRTVFVKGGTRLINGKAFPQTLSCSVLEKNNATTT